MQSEIMKSDLIDLWSKYMEVTITLILTILDDIMKNMDRGGEVKNNRDNEKSSTETI